MNDNQKIRFGVLGCSRIAKRSVLPALAESPVAHLSMIGSRVPEQVKSVAVEYGCSTGTYDDVLKSDIDAVYISLPNSLHEEWAVKAAGAGKHVWCEKPAALTYPSAKRMVEAAKRNSVRLMEGFMFLSHPQHAKVRQLIDGGTLGELLTFDGCFAVPMPGKEANILKRDLGGGVLNDAAVYPIAASRIVFNAEPVSVACTLALDAQTGIDTKVDMLLTYPGGKSAFVSSIFGSYFQSTYRVLGTQAQVALERAYAVPKDRAVKIFLNKDDTITEIPIEPADHFRLMIDDFCKEIMLGARSTKKYGADLLVQARILDAARLSHAEKRFVALSEIV
ncbi:MAG TPA: Gfo/Idh/MocA family oxidoreductase [Candidatus Paceibacterota bacterium]